MAIAWDQQSRLNTGFAEPTPVAGLEPALAARLRQVRTIAFDLDSTLIDFFRWKTRACEAAIRALVDAGVDLSTTSEDNVGLVESDLARRLLDTYLATGVEGDAAITRFLESVDGHAEPGLVSVAVAGYMRGKAAALEPYPRTLPTLVRLLKAGYELAVVTDAPRAKAVHRLATTNLLPFFDTVVTIDDVGSGKETEAPFHELMRRMRRAAPEVLMVGDWPQKDIRTPRRLGMVTALAKYGMQPIGMTLRDEDRPDLVLQRIDDLTRTLDTVHGQRGVRP